MATKPLSFDKWITAPENAGIYERIKTDTGVMMIPYQYMRRYTNPRELTIITNVPFKVMSMIVNSKALHRYSLIPLRGGPKIYWGDVDTDDGDMSIVEVDGPLFKGILTSYTQSEIDAQPAFVEKISRVPILREVSVSLPPVLANIIAEYSVSVSVKHISIKLYWEICHRRYVRARHCLFMRGVR